MSLAVGQGSPTRPQVGARGCSCVFVCARARWCDVGVRAHVCAHVYVCVD